MKKRISFALISIALLFAQACGPPKLEQFVDIETNETAFVVPLEGATDEQGKFASAAYLKTKQVAAKRISLPLREVSTGRMAWSYKWVPTVRVVKVDRTPVTREWTDNGATGTSTKDDALAVESKDSIGFTIGATITVAVEEEDAAKFLYHYAGKPLAEVVDQNIRSFVKTCVGERFGKLPLEDKRDAEGKLVQAGCKTSKVTIFKECTASAKTAFEGNPEDPDSGRGITIVNLGYAGGLNYENPAIQKSIDDAYTAEMMVKQRDQERLAQEKENDRLLSIAVNEKLQAQEFAKAQVAWTAKTRLEIERMNAEARLTASKRWDGSAPASILPQGSQMLFGLDAPMPTDTPVPTPAAPDPVLDQ